MIKFSDISNNKRLTIFGGVNVIEDDDILYEVAETFSKLSKSMDFNFVFKASFDKANRSSVDSYRGPGIKDGLKALQNVKNKLNVPIITDIHEPWQAEIVAEICDVIQIPAFLCRQTDLVAAAAKTKKIINFKKPQFSSAKELGHAVDKCESFGNSNIILCERGNIFGYNNLIVDILNFQILKGFNKPVIFDVTHSLQQPGALQTSTGGRSEFVFDLAKAGVSQKIAGLFIETHPDPLNAKCDGPCALKLSELGDFLSRLFELDQLIKEQ